MFYNIPLNFSGLRDAEEETRGEKEPALASYRGDEPTITDTPPLE